MPKYEVYASNLQYHVIEIEADNEEDAYEKAWNAGDGWRIYDNADWQLEGIDEIRGDKKCD